MDSRDWAIVFATLFGPILAVQAQKWIERSHRIKERQVQVFEALLRTFATRLASDHVQALNMIEAVFMPRGLFFFWNRHQNEKVIEAWRLYMIHLSKDLKSFTPSEHDTHFRASDAFFRDLMHAMSEALHYGISKDVFARGAYHPQANADLEVLHRRLLESMNRVFSGEKDLLMQVTKLPVSEDAIKAQSDLSSALIQAFQGGALRVVKQDHTGIKHRDDPEGAN